MTVAFTDEQRAALAHDGGLLLTATAGSGKTSVMAERYVRAAVAEGGDLGRLLAITFTEKAAAELKARVRARFEALGDGELARATESAWISTIHGFCARLLRAHALEAGIDPRFAVLDERDARRLAEQAARDALDDLVAAHGEAALELIAAYRAGALCDEIVALHGELRSRGQERPRLPAPRPADLAARRRALALARAQAAAELEGARDGKTVARARAALAACAALLDGDRGRLPAPAKLAGLRLPGGNAAALTGPGCAAYREALAAFEDACADAAAVPVCRLLDALLEAFGVRYAAAKAAASALDFEDLELGANRLLRDRPAIRARYAERFRHVLIDEFQDTNPLQLELLERIAGDRLYAVGDELQSIYGFRHADVSLFRARRAALSQRGDTATLATNFRSHPELLAAFNRAFAPRFGASFTPLRAGRGEPAAGRDEGAPRVELIVVDRDADWEHAGLVPPGAVPPAPLWRLAEARAVAARVRALLDAGWAPGDVVLLLRATGDLTVFERALIERGVPTYVIGGRGYWSQQQVRDLVSYLAVLANPRDEVSLLTVLASPLVGLSSDALVHLAAAARERRRDLWWTLIGDAQAGDGQPADGDRGVGEPLLERLDPADRERVLALRAWLPHERRAASRHSLEALIERALARTGYDLALLRMDGGARRLANVRKLMRLAREHEAGHGRDLHGFVELARGLVDGADGSGDERESEAPVEGEALDAVRVMTIHRSKGLEFPVVVVADLGREPPASWPLVRVGRDGRVGVRVRRLDGAPGRPALAYAELAEERRRAEAEEEARLFYVAATRARERLILSGAIRCEPWPDERPGRPPLAWLGPAFLPEIGRLCVGSEPRGVVAGDGPPVAYAIVRPDTLAGAPEADAPEAEGDADAGPAPRLGCEAPAATDAREGERRGNGGAPGRDAAAAPAVAHGGEGPANGDAREGDPVGTGGGGDMGPPARPTAPIALSYTSLQEHARCGYRFYLERVLGLPRTDDPTLAPAVAARSGAAALAGRLRGSVAHAALERARFGAAPPGIEAVRAAAALAGAELTDEQAREIVALLARLGGSALWARLGSARDVRREQRFALRLRPADGVEAPLVGAIDVLAREDGGRALVVDWKTDRIGDDEAPEELAAREYALQRSVYALAALRDGAAAVEVVHCFLERPEEPATARFDAADAPALEADLRARAAAVHAREFRVAAEPGPRVCDGCPGRGSLCSWPLERTRGAPEGRLL